MISALWRQRRREPILFLSPLLIVLATIHFSAVPHGESALPLQGWSLGLSIVFIVGPVVASCVAYSVGRLKDADILAAHWPRHLASIISQSIVIPATVGWLVIMGCGLVMSGFSIPDMRLVLVVTAALGQMLALGVIAAVLLPSIVATPTVLVIGYLWMVLPMAFEPLWLRHLNGYWSTCCMADQVPAWQGVIGVLLVACSLWAVVVAAFLTKVVKKAVFVMVGIIIFFGGLFSVSTLGAFPVVFRGAETVCKPVGEGGELCLFPEHEPQREQVMQVIESVMPAWSDLVPIGQVRYSEAHSQVSISSYFPEGISRENIVSTLAVAHLPEVPDCGNRPYENGIFYEEAWQILMAKGGILVNNESVTERVATTSDQELREWFAQTVAQIEQCS
ncbi:DUF7224 domain-containing protein [Arcanobacterium pinnipediorum]|uniref:DUF7224 domain-containing protein n=1 Tax=Arcanobacterium pinnipediorum TaxID=1503041 RepID=A0ABY5AIS1_9ACTO|nr:hypothetical protein [Arcanobacterium pinnipediorum]USR79987.1 hypothetical protein NG665_03135 [Arcanobacterium pinnipediorum]